MVYSLHNSSWVMVYRLWFIGLWCTVYIIVDMVCNL